MLPRLSGLIGIISGSYIYNIASATTADPPHITPVIEITGINISNVTVFDCPSSTSVETSQDQLQAAMNSFAYIFYMKNNVKLAFETYVASNYVQHNPDIADGRDAAITALEPLFKDDAHGFDIARVMVGHEYTTIHIRATNKGGPSFNVFDVYRTKGSCIVEHWDCMQEMANHTMSLHPYF